MKALAVLLAVLFSATITIRAYSAAASDQRLDGFGPNPPLPRPPDRGVEQLGTCHFQGFLTNPAGEVYDAWLCRDGAIVLFPTPCSHHPTSPCKES